MWCHGLIHTGIIVLACANNHIFLLIQLHYLFCLYYTPIKANMILEFMTLFSLHYQYVEIIVCWEIKLHYCVSFSCLINNDGWLLFSSPPGTILSSSLNVKNEKKKQNKKYDKGRRNRRWVLSETEGKSRESEIVKDLETLLSVCLFLLGCTQGLCL